MDTLKHTLLCALPALLLITCSDDTTDPGPDACVPLFGIPSANTGLDGTMCGPSCGCPERTLTAREYTSAHIEKLAQTTQLDPPALLGTDPYDATAPVFDPTQVCTVQPEATSPGAYRLVTLDSVQEAETAGVAITHHGPCGACSSLQDLSVYMSYPDLTGPARECGVLGLTDGELASVTCYRELGFSDPCAEIYFFNSRNTRVNCLVECLAALEDPYHLPDGSLNGCLQCDEDISGDVFKAVAGRSRRNSGLASALCRPCDEVPVVGHDYPDVIGN